jgi:phosphoglycolate phosphatase-like HAD superfamily hydrolase
MQSQAALLRQCSRPIELRPSLQPRPQISHVVFDFDGTLSWLRHGWPEIMASLFRELLPARANESSEEVQTLLMNLILSLNGKPTIFQTMRFTELVTERGGTHLDAEALRAEYQRRLDAEIAARSQLIRQGQSPADAFVVHRARALLEHLQAAGCKLLVLSSTVEERVKEEAELLQLTSYFGEHIYGGVGDPTQFSKRAVFERILRTENILGENLLSFGDGPVEIQDTKALGGLAIAICSDENHNGSGQFDSFKKTQLLQAGADAALPDFQDACLLFDYLSQPAM